MTGWEKQHLTWCVLKHPHTQAHIWRCNTCPKCKYKGLTRACIRLRDHIKPLNARKSFTHTYNGHTHVTHMSRRCRSGNVHVSMLRAQCVRVVYTTPDTRHKHATPTPHEHYVQLFDRYLGMHTGRCYLCFAYYVSAQHSSICTHLHA